DHTLNTAELTKRLLEDVNSERLKLIFDPFNVLLPSEIDKQTKVYDTYFELVGKYIEIIHMKGLEIENSEKTWTTLEKGLINYEYIFNWLYKNKPNAPILREHIMLQTYKEDLQFMRRFIRPC
ncbi:MAG: TIM barrel protein, partial [Defluviitaleaceae bacterium]|nr:TIM barrel protein [Defluviitaleaceae bacterium]